MLRSYLVLISLCMSALAVCYANEAHAMLKCGGNGTKIDAGLSPYSALPQGNGITAYSEEELRSTAITSFAGAYRLANGVGALPVGSTFKVIYQDDSRECAQIVSTTGSFGAVPVAGTQRDSAGTGEVEDTDLYIRNFQRNYPRNGWYRVCYDYYSDGYLTATECNIYPW